MFQEFFGRQLELVKQKQYVNIWMHEYMNGYMNVYMNGFKRINEKKIPKRTTIVCQKIIMFVMKIMRILKKKIGVNCKGIQ